MSEEKSGLKEEQFDAEDFKGRNAQSIGIGLAIGTIIGFFIIFVVLVKYFFF